MPEKPASGRSLRGRLQAAGTLPVIAFFCLGGLLLDQAVQRYAENGMRAQLENVFYGLIALVDFHPDHGFQLQGALPTPALGALETGLSARILIADKQAFWESPNMATLDLPAPDALEQGHDRFRFVDLKAPGSHAEYAYAVAWETAPEQFTALTFQVLQDATAYHQQVRNTRIFLLSGAALLGSLVFAFQAWMLRSGLRPLREIAHDLHLLQAGSQARLAENYPDEIQELANALNSLVEARELQLERYRNSLADLAHGLKTPLSVIRSASEQHRLPRAFASELDAQAGRINELIEYHLQRARAAGRALGTGRVELQPLAGQLQRTLQKIYHDRGLLITSEVPADMHARMDAQDLMEVLGNVMDNACKWAKSQVVVDAHASGDRVELLVCDDGPGFPHENRERLTSRGVRADERTPGHGFGLAIVQELVVLGGGKLFLEDAPQGGARVRIDLPAA